MMEVHIENHGAVKLRRNSCTYNLDPGNRNHRNSSFFTRGLGKAGNGGPETLHQAQVHHASYHRVSYSRQISLHPRKNERN